VSKNPKKKDYWWILVLVLIFAPSLLGKVVKAALAMIPLGIIAAVVLAIVFGNKKSKEKSAEVKAEEAEVLAQAAEAEREKSDRAMKKKLSRFSRSGLHRALAVICYVLGGFCGLGAAIAAVEAQGAAAAMGDVMAMTVVTLWFIGCGAILHIISDIRRKRAQDAVRYATLIGERESYSLAKLASAASYKIEKIRDDLQRMIDGGIFGEQAYIDMANLCFMRTPDAVPDGVREQHTEYTRTMYSGGADIEKNAPSVSQETPQDTAADLGEIGETDCGAILANIRRLDEEIRDEAVSERIRKIETITKNIFEYIKDKPEKLPQIRMFMNYYLPTTLKLLESYSRIERVGVAGQNMQEAKDNIEKILDMLVVGFEQQFDQLFGAESMDITSDIEVLEQMMKKDGLSGAEDFVIREDVTDSFTDEISDDLAGGAAQAKDL